MSTGGVHRNGWVIGVALGLLFAVPAAAALHTVLRSSEPRADAALETPPERILLEFSGPVNARLSSIVLIRDGAHEVPLEVGADATQPSVLLAEVPHLAAGAYQVRWRTVAADGHAVTGSFSFTLTADAAKQAPGEPERVMVAAPVVPVDPEPALSLSILPRAVTAGTVLTLLPLAGLLIFLAWVARGASVPPGLLYVLSGLAAVFLAAELFMWLSQMRGLGVGFGDALATEQGTWRAARVILAGLACALLFVGFLKSSAIAAVGAVLVGAAVGHPAAYTPLVAIPANALHQLAAGVWSGGLLLLLMGDRDAEQFRANAARVSQVALVSVIVIAVTGGTMSFLLIGDPALMFGTPYGRLTLGKILGFMVLFAFGARNRLKLMPTLSQEAGPAALRRSVNAEIRVMVLVLVLAAVLASVAPPVEG